MIETATYGDWNLDELRDELRERQLPVSGNKPELVERLVASDAASAGPDPDADGDGADGDVGEDDEVTDGAGNPVVADGDSAAAEPKRPGECVVDDGTPHTGRAVNGVVCSAHAMHYRADGTRR